MDWRYEGDTRKAELRAYYGKITRMRRDTPVLSRGSFTTLVTQGKGLIFARELDGKLAVSVFNAGPAPVTMTLSSEALQNLTTSGAEMVFEVQVGPEEFPRSTGASFVAGDKIDLRGGDFVELVNKGPNRGILWYHIVDSN